MNKLNGTTHSCGELCGVQFGLLVPCAMEPMTMEEWNWTSHVSPPRAQLRGEVVRGEASEVRGEASGGGRGR